MRSHNRWPFGQVCQNLIARQVLAWSILTMTYWICKCIIFVWQTHSTLVKTVSKDDVVTVIFVFGKGTIWTINHLSSGPIVAILEDTLVHTDDHFVGSAKCANTVRAGVTCESVVAHWPTCRTFTGEGWIRDHVTVMGTATVVDEAASGMDSILTIIITIVVASSCPWFISRCRCSHWLSSCSWTRISCSGICISCGRCRLYKF